jgi:hypothetical protein
MNRLEFENLRNLPGKRIEGDIIFSRTKDTRSYLSFEKIQVINQFKWNILLNGKYWNDIPTYIFNFSIVDVGPICRIEVNSNEHYDSGRTHKHEFTKESDCRNNLPTAYNRKDFEDLEILDGWEKLCKEAKILHDGKFIFPEV